MKKGTVYKMALCGLFAAIMAVCSWMAIASANGLIGTTRAAKPRRNPQRVAPLCGFFFVVGTVRSDRLFGCVYYSTANSGYARGK